MLDVRFLFCRYILPLTGSLSQSSSSRYLYSLNLFFSTPFFFGKGTRPSSSSNSTRLFLGRFISRPTVSFFLSILFFELIREGVSIRFYHWRRLLTRFCLGAYIFSRLCNAFMTVVQQDPVFTSFISSSSTVNRAKKGGFLLFSSSFTFLSLG